MKTLITRAVAPWFGANRLLAEHVGEELAGNRWVGVPFAGGRPVYSAEDGKRIMELRATGASVRDISAQTGMSRSHVGRIIKAETLL